MKTKNEWLMENKETIRLRAPEPEDLEVILSFEMMLNFGS